MLSSRWLATIAVAALALGLAVAAPSPVIAETLPTYTATGRVLDPTGAPLAGATVGLHISPPFMGTAAQAEGVTAADGTYTLSVVGPIGSETETVSVAANGMTWSGTTPTQTTLSVGDLRLPANATEREAIRIIDASGDPVPNFRFRYQMWEVEDGSQSDGCLSTVTTTGTPLSGQVQCDWYVTGGTNYTPSKATRTTDIDGRAEAWGPPGLARTSISADYTDPSGVQHAYSGNFVTTRNPAGSDPAATLTYRLDDVDFTPPPVPVGFTATGGECGYIKVRLNSPTPQQAIVKVYRDGTEVNTGTYYLSGPEPYPSAVAAGSVEEQGRYGNACGERSGFKAGIYTVTAIGWNEKTGRSAPTTPVTVHVGEWPLTHSATWLSTRSVISGNRALTAHWQAFPSTTPTTNTATLTATPVAGGARRSVSVPYRASGGTVSGLTPGVAYRLELAATNAVGGQSVALGTGTPGGAPAKVVGIKSKVKGKGKRKTVTLTWRVPESYGSPVTAYKLTGSKKATTRKAKVAFKRLKRGTYKFRVTAVNKYGKGVASKVVKVKVR